MRGLMALLRLDSTRARCTPSSPSHRRSFALVSSPVRPSQPGPGSQSVTLRLSSRSPLTSTCNERNATRRGEPLRACIAARPPYAFAIPESRKRVWFSPHSPLYARTSPPSSVASRNSHQPGPVPGLHASCPPSCWSGRPSRRSPRTATVSCSAAPMQPCPKSARSRRPGLAPGQKVPVKSIAPSKQLLCSQLAYGSQALLV